MPRPQIAQTTVTTPQHWFKHVSEASINDPALALDNNTDVPRDSDPPSIH